MFLLLILVILLIFCIVMFVITSQNKSKGHQKLSQQISQRHASLYAVCPHVQGLPIPENTLCTIYSVPGRYEITASGNNFNLEKNKITDMCIKTDFEIVSQQVSSIGGAIGGAVLFGPLGAVIGGRAKEKKSKKMYQYLIITYEFNGEIKYIGFDATANSQASALVKEFNAYNIHHSTTINL